MVIATNPKVIPGPSNQKVIIVAATIPKVEVSKWAQSCYALPIPSLLWPCSTSICATDTIFTEALPIPTRFR
jgi:hypothetical protein